MLCSRLKRTKTLGCLLQKRTNDGGQTLDSAVNACGTNYKYLGAVTTLRTYMDDEYIKLGFSDALAQRLETYDLTTVTANDALGRRADSGLIVRIKAHTTIRNNNFVPMVCYVYVIICRKNNNETIANHFTQGMLDRHAGAATNWQDEPAWFPSDSRLFNNYWKILKRTKVIINPSHQIVT